MKRMPFIFIFLLVLSLADTASSSETRTFKTLTGVPIKATFLTIEKQGKKRVAVLKLAQSGRLYRTPVASLSKEDQDWINKSESEKSNRPETYVPGRLPLEDANLYSDRFVYGLIKTKILEEVSIFEYLDRNRIQLPKLIPTGKAWERLKIDPSRLRSLTLVDNPGRYFGDHIFFHAQISPSFDLIGWGPRIPRLKIAVVEKLDRLAIIPHTPELIGIILSSPDCPSLGKMTIREGKVVEINSK